MSVYKSSAPCNSNTVDTSIPSAPITSADTEEFDMPPSSQKREKNLVPILPSAAEAADRTGNSQRGAAMIASSVLQDILV